LGAKNTPALNQTNLGLIIVKKEVAMLCSLATDVNDSTLQTISSLEKGLGKTLLIFKCHDLKPSALTNKELSKVQDAEKKLGVSLVAVED
jgi:hypothetical protein